MEFLIAFLVFIFVISILGFILSFLWPILLAIIIIGGIAIYIAYRKRKKLFNEFYQNASESMFYEQQGNDSANVGSEDIIDVEFSEEEINDK